MRESTPWRKRLAQKALVWCWRVRALLSSLHTSFAFLAIAIGFAQAGFSRISIDLDDVARLLGAGPGTLARTIHLPLAQPAIFGAALLIFVDCLKELPATLLLRPLNVETLATYIYQFATRGSFEQGSLAALIIVAVGILPVIRITRYADIATRLTLDARS